MVRILSILLLSIILPLGLQAQLSRKQRISYAKGNFFGYWGYNRSFYTKSNIQFVGSGYDFHLAGSAAKDNPSNQFKQYINPTTLTVPQFNARFGYYFKDHYAISLGYDHMKYIFKDLNNVMLNGTIDQSLGTVYFDSVNPIVPGTYSNLPVTTDRDLFHYENSNGLNYIRAELTRTDLLMKVGKSFAITSNVSLGTGVLLSYNDLTFAGQKDMVTISLSGFALSSHAALKFEFWNLLFLRTGVSGGYMNQLHVKTRPDDASAFARHQYGYLLLDTSLGFQFFVQPKHKCNTCPNW
jgi:hypothetical protein